MSLEEDAAAEMAAKEKAEAEKEKASQTELDKEPIKQRLNLTRSQPLICVLLNISCEECAKSEQTNTGSSNWTSVVRLAKYSASSQHTTRRARR
ncbi:hypothetical protein OK016_03205 [Vibrio chagasii]|nr:hypothetical protein [Vibrio chagasii]